MPQPLPEQPTQATFRDGAIAIMPINVAAAPVALVYGALALDVGLSPLEVILSSAIVFAGSAQFLALELWEVPVPITGLALAVLLINLRHVLMG
ncbi:MAG: AzlC family ABC transporter permease, partial [Pseudomonadota bacterium]